MRGLKTILFLIISNTFMTFAWYGHLRFKDFSWGKIRVYLQSFSSAGDSHFLNTCTRCRRTGAASEKMEDPIPWSS